MTNFYDDQSSPAKGFSGDDSNSGDIFESQDLVGASPTTSERVVDTQSGYLVVLKKVDGTRVALSVKRRIGTPPSSFVLLTPDEQVKMAKILAEAKAHAKRVSPQAEQWANGLASKTRAAEEEQFRYDTAPEKEFERVLAERQEEYEQIRSSITPRRGDGKLFLIAALAGSLAIVSVGGFLAFKHLAASKPLAGKTTATTTTTEATKTSSTAQSDDARVDHFVRGFVADMLDFNEATYKPSQIHAMAVMTPELLERYWKETNFPLSKAQLNSIPKGQTLIITKVVQEPAANQSTSVDLFAELAGQDSKISTPVHLQLNVSSGPDGQLRVLDQKDLSSSSK